ncbi:ParB/RepB/Spo0J family partition protein [Nosocomiicoccus ampullae]|uniref:ParB/RepB/Spo0J family partition protein n=1 Tax=Nosocomiicoccus ampullae TaxID=489910 RepID=UPI00254BA9E5|nr:ParB/RepB/Spo0J family partition protein [Nosocomiicoccus ampullae]MDK6862834.1 ParB/RepB/Spo0J family partition protein [Nosocomiicoccus ampullae]
MSRIESIRVSDIKPNPYQPRLHFDEKELNALKVSIQENGLVQPIIVRQTVIGYTLIAGERRWRAFKALNLETIDAIVKEMSDEEMMTYAIIENLQREDLDPFEEAMSYKKYMETLNLNQSETAKKLGKSRSYIANMIRLLNLPHSVIQLIQDGKLTTAHGRTLLSLKNQLHIEEIAKRIVDEKWNVRETERFVRKFEATKKTEKKYVEKPAPIARVEQSLKRRLGTDVDIKQVGKKGQIVLSFTSVEEYKRLVTLLSEIGED